MHFYQIFQNSNTKHPSKIIRQMQNIFLIGVNLKLSDGVAGWGVYSRT